MAGNKFQRFAVFGLLYVNLGRPQDVLPFLKSIHPGMILGLLVLCTLFKSKNKTQIISNEFNHEKQWFIALGFVMFLSTLVSIYLSASVEFLLDYSKVIILLIGLLSVLEDEIDFTVLAKIFLISVLTLCTPIVIHGVGSDRISIGTYYDPNDIAMFISCSIPFLLYLYHLEHSKIKYISLVGIIIAVISVIATQSRMGFISLILNGLFYLFFTISFHFNAMRKFTIVAGIVFVFLASAGDFYWDRVKTTFEHGQTGSGRTVLWKRSMKMIAKYPFIGSGPGTYVSSYGRMLQDGQFEAVGNEYDRAWKTAHNSYFIVAAELGVAGLLFFLLILLNTFGRLNKVRKLCVNDKNRKNIQIMANVTISSFFVFIFCSLFLSQAYSSLLITLIASSVLVRNIYYNNTIKST